MSLIIYAIKMYISMPLLSRKWNKSPYYHEFMYFMYGYFQFNDTQSFNNIEIFKKGRISKADWNKIEKQLNQFKSSF